VFAAMNKNFAGGSVFWWIANTEGRGGIEE
jgi:hypothetical protein